LAYGRWEVSIKAGLGLTPTPIERASAKQREHEALLARYALGDTLQKLLDELQRNRRDVGNELANQRTFGPLLQHCFRSEPSRS